VLAKFNHRITYVSLEFTSIVNFGWVEEIHVRSRFLDHSVDVPGVEAHVQNNQYPVTVEDKQQSWYEFHD
jgi:hypothetical protein